MNRARSEPSGARSGLFINDLINHPAPRAIASRWSGHCGWSRRPESFCLTRSAPGKRQLTTTPGGASAWWRGHHPWL